MSCNMNKTITLALPIAFIKFFRLIKCLQQRYNKHNHKKTISRKFKCLYKHSHIKFIFK